MIEEITIDHQRLIDAVCRFLAAWEAARIVLDVSQESSELSLSLAALRREVS